MNLYGCKNTTIKNRVFLNITIYWIYTLRRIYRPLRQGYMTKIWQRYSFISPVNIVWLIALFTNIEVKLLSYDPLIGIYIC